MLLPHPVASPVPSENFARPVIRNAPTVRVTAGRREIERQAFDLRPQHLRNLNQVGPQRRHFDHAVARPDYQQFLDIALSDSEPSDAQLATFRSILQDLAAGC